MPGCRGEVENIKAKFESTSTANFRIKIALNPKPQFKKIYSEGSV
jgi:hypothetical protein